jgi:hypothetical protein
MAANVAMGFHGPECDMVVCGIGGLAAGWAFVWPDDGSRVHGCGVLDACPTLRLLGAAKQKAGGVVVSRTSLPLRSGQQLLALSGSVHAGAAWCGHWRTECACHVYRLV